MTMLCYERVSHLTSLAKYAVAFLDVTLLRNHYQFLLQPPYPGRLIVLHDSVGRPECRFIQP